MSEPMGSLFFSVIMGSIGVFTTITGLYLIAVIKSIRKEIENCKLNCSERFKICKENCDREFNDIKGWQGKQDCQLNELNGRIIDIVKDKK